MFGNEKSYQVGIWDRFLSFWRFVYFIPNKNEWQGEANIEGKQIEIKHKEEFAEV